MRNGFTLLEILVTVAISVMISGFAISYGTSVQRQLDLFADTQKVAELVLRAKSLAISTYNDPANPSPPGFERCGYGVSIYRDVYGEWRYKMFLYQVSLGSAERCGNLMTLSRDPANFVTVSDFDIGLNRGVIFGQAGGLIQPDLCAVLFLPPEPKTKTVVHGQNGANCVPSGFQTTTPFTSPTAAGRIRLFTQDRSSAMTITVGAAGQVDF